MAKKVSKPNSPAQPEPSSKPAKLGYAPPALKEDAEFGQSLVSWLMPAYILMIVLGMFAFRFGRAMPASGEMTHDRALFTSINAASLTGFQQIFNPNTYEPMGQAIIFLLVLGGSLFSQISGGLAVKRILRLPWSDWRVLRAAVVCQACAIMVGVLIPFDKYHDFTGSISQAISAYGNCGTFLGHLRTPLGGGQPAMVPLIHFVLLPMAIFGGLGLPVLIEIYDKLRHGTAFTRHALTVFVMTAGLYLGGWLLLVLVRAVSSPAPAFDTAGAQLDYYRQLFVSSSAMAINCRTAGLPLDALDTYPRVAQWILILLMAVGASPAGTGGGLKSTTIYVIFCDVKKILRGQSIDRGLAIALSWLGIYLLIAVVCQLVLLATLPAVSGDRTLFLSISALSNVGLSQDSISMTGTALYTLSLTMLAGRMIPVMILWWMADTNRGAEVAVG